MMAMERQERVMIAVLNLAPPTEEEWERWIELGKARLGADLRCICEVHGNVGPNARQRQALTPWLGKIDMRTAVLSDSLIVRGLVTAVSWLGVQNNAFSPSDVDGVARYLGLTSDERTKASASLLRLRRIAGVRRKPSLTSFRPRPPS